MGLILGSGEETLAVRTNFYPLSSWNKRELFMMLDKQKNVSTLFKSAPGDDQMETALSIPDCMVDGTQISHPMQQDTESDMRQALLPPYKWIRSCNLKRATNQRQL